MIKIAICDDEKNVRTYLSALIRKQNVACEITEYTFPKEYLSDSKEYDLLFLDIELNDPQSGMDGMNTARQIRDRNLVRQPIIIFVTGFEEYVYEAFDVGAFQYLLKPVDEQKFAGVFRRAVNRILAEAERQKKKLVIQYGSESRVITLESIYYMESQGHKVVIHTKDEVLKYYAKMGELEEELQGQFFRIHKGYLVNLAYVDEYNKAEVTLVNGDKLLISRYKYADFVKTYLRFIK